MHSQEQKINFKFEVLTLAEWTHFWWLSVCQVDGQMIPQALLIMKIVKVIVSLAGDKASSATIKIGLRT